MTGQPITQLQGADNLIRTLRAASREIEDFGSVNTASASTLRSRAASGAPKRSGRLAASLRASSDKHQAVMDYGALPYAGRTHWGWPSVGQIAQPFATNALENSEPVIVQAHERRVEQVVSHIRGK